MSEKEEEAIPIEEGTAKQVQQLGRGNRDPVKKTTRIEAERQEHIQEDGRRDDRLSGEPYQGDQLAEVADRMWQSILSY